MDFCPKSYIILHNLLTYIIALQGKLETVVIIVSPYGNQFLQQSRICSEQRGKDAALAILNNDQTLNFTRWIEQKKIILINDMNDIFLKSIKKNIGIIYICDSSWYTSSSISSVYNYLKPRSIVLTTYPLLCINTLHKYFERCFIWDRE